MSQSCPKCGKPAKEKDTSCARCGLLRSRWGTFSDKPEPHAVLDPLWNNALASWTDEKPHKALAAVAGTDWSALSALAQRYHHYLREHPEDPIATKAMDHLIKAALSLPPPRQPQETPKVVKGVRAAFGILLLCLSSYLFYLFWQRLGIHR